MRDPYTRYSLIYSDGTKEAVSSSELGRRLLALVEKLLLVATPNYLCDGRSLIQVECFDDEKERGP